MKYIRLLQFEMKFYYLLILTLKAVFHIKQTYDIGIPTVRYAESVRWKINAAECPF